VAVIGRPESAQIRLLQRPCDRAPAADQPNRTDSRGRDTCGGKPRPNQAALASVDSWIPTAVQMHVGRLLNKFRCRVALRTVRHQLITSWSSNSGGSASCNDNAHLNETLTELSETIEAVISVQDAQRTAHTQQYLHDTGLDRVS